MGTTQETFPFVEGSSAISTTRRFPLTRSKVWDAGELAIGYVLILLVIWTPRPEQRWLFWLTLSWFAASLAFSYPGRKELGFHVAGFWRSFWVVGAAAILAGAATILANDFQTLHHPNGLEQWVRTFGGYAVWSFVQQVLMQGYFLLRLLRLMPSPTLAAISAASIFALAHLPNPILTPVTLVWGIAACLIFLKFRNIYPLAIAHAIFGICIAVTVPANMLHNMRVGLGYFTFHPPHRHHLSQSDHSVSTVVWVNADAPTRRSARQALP